MYCSAAAAAAADAAVTSNPRGSENYAQTPGFTNQHKVNTCKRVQKFLVRERVRQKNQLAIEQPNPQRLCTRCSTRFSPLLPSQPRLQQQLNIECRKTTPNLCCLQHTLHSVVHANLVTHALTCGRHLWQRDPQLPELGVHGASCRHGCS